MQPLAVQAGLANGQFSTNITYHHRYNNKKQLGLAQKASKTTYAEPPKGYRWPVCGKCTLTKESFSPAVCNKLGSVKQTVFLFHILSMNASRCSIETIWSFPYIFVQPLGFWLRTIATFVILCLREILQNWHELTHTNHMYTSSSCYGPIFSILLFLMGST